MKKLTGFLLATLLIFGLSLTGWGQTGTPSPTPPPITPSPTYTADCIYSAEGYVHDQMTGYPVVNATVRADTSATTTDTSGFYHVSHLQINCNALYVEVSAPGYETQRKYTGSTPGLWTLNFDLVPLSEPTIFIPGDVNSDKKVDIIDAMLVARYSAGLTTSGFEPRAADVNGSANFNSTAIDILDALVIAQYSAGTVANLISVQPTSGLPGTQVTVTGISFDPTANEIRFISSTGSIEYFTKITASSTDSLRITFNVPTYVHPYCYYDPLPCAAPDQLVMGGIYYITVTTSKGVSYAVPFVVNPI